MPKLDGILETAIHTEDMPRARAFYEGVLDAATAGAVIKKAYPLVVVTVVDTEKHSTDSTPS